MRPYFERSERRVAPDGRALTPGPLDVKDVTPYLHPMGKEWLDAAAELKLPVTADFNGPNPEGLRLLSTQYPQRPPLVGCGRLSSARLEAP